MEYIHQLRRLFAQIPFPREAIIPKNNLDIDIFPKI